MTGCPRLSASFCPNTRAMMSLPPPAAKPTMRWIGRDGYFAGSSWARAGVAAPAISAANPRHAVRREYRFGILMELVLCLDSKPRDLDMQYGRLAVVERGKRAVDRGLKLVRLGDAFAMGAERLCHGGKIAPLALAAGHQPRLELVGLGGNALRVDPLHCRFHGLPAAIVQNDRQHRNLVLLRHRIDAVG